jgi:hypothetical protein
MSRFRLVDGQLQIETEAGSEPWRAVGVLARISQIQEILDGGSVVVLFDYSDWEQRESLNLMRVDALGRVVWHACDREHLLSGDVLVSLDIKSGVPRVTSWFGKSLLVDVQTGDLTYEGFTK